MLGLCVARASAQTTPAPTPAPPAQPNLTAPAEQPDLGAAPVDGTDNRWSLLENRPWIEPLIADPRGPHVAAIAYGYGKEFEYMVEGGNRPMWDISLGKEIPVVAFDTKHVGDRYAAPGGFGIGLWLPVNFHMVSDFKDDSSPIINTDYRFGAVVKATYGFTGQQSVSAKVHFGHESTHLGDEFTIHATEKYGAAFERINVSYEYFEYGLDYAKEAWFTTGPTRWDLNARVGFTHTADRGHVGFYSETLLDGSRTIVPSTRNHEPWFGVQLLPSDRGFIGDWAPFVSLDGRWRTLYDFNKTSPDESEDSQLSLSFVTGLRKVQSVQRGRPDLMIKGYYGGNPNGQFRGQKNYWMLGIGLYVRV